MSTEVVTAATAAPTRVDVLEVQVAVLAWLHAELAWKHASLVSELQTMIAQAMGPAGMDPARLQQLRSRAIRLAKLRKTQT